MRDRAAEYDLTHSARPLARVVLCCTSVPSDVRSLVVQQAMKMGASYKADLTSDVTHLIAGDIMTPKYKFSAKHRLDVKLMKVEWIGAMYERWLEGEDINVEEYSEKLLLPPFLNLRICVTSLPPSDRQKLHSLITSNGGHYSPDLSKTCTHLIAASKEGKKYEYAVKWGIKIVGQEWVRDSLVRGAALSEELYSLDLPEEERGRGAWDKPIEKPEGLAPAKRKEVSRVDEDEDDKPVLKKKRSQLSQSFLGPAPTSNKTNPAGAAPVDDLWKDIFHMKPLAASTPIKSRADAAWHSDDEEELDLSKVHPPPVYDESGTPALDEPEEEKEKEKGIWYGVYFYPWGFSEEKTNILYTYLTSHGGHCVDTLSALPPDKPERSFVVVSHSVPIVDCPNVPSERATLVTEQWLERCVHFGRRVEIDDWVASRPLVRTHIPGMKGLTIAMTGFTGVDLLHMSKLINVLGASYSETLRRDTSALIARKPEGRKWKMAGEWGVRVLSREWVEDVARKGEVLGVGRYAMDGLGGGELPKREGKCHSQQVAEKVVNDSAVQLMGPPLLTREKQKERGSNRRLEEGHSSRRLSMRMGDEDDEVVDKKKVRNATRARVLEGCTVCVSSKLSDMASEYLAIAVSLGANIVQDFSAGAGITHLVHESLRHADAHPDFRAAKAVGCKIVSPSWLFECRKKATKVDEAMFPYIHAFETDAKERVLANVDAKRANSAPSAPVQDPRVASGIGNLAKLLQRNLTAGVLSDTAPKRVRGKLQGRATASITTHRSTSDPAPFDAAPNPLADEDARPSQDGVKYDDPDAQREKRRILMKLNGGVVDLTEEDDRGERGRSTREMSPVSDLKPVRTRAARAARHIG
ncbi:protein kinase activating protein dpb11 [Saitoella coloradoensis]